MRPFDITYDIVVTHRPEDQVRVNNISLADAYDPYRRHLFHSATEAAQTTNDEKVRTLRTKIDTLEAELRTLSTQLRTRENQLQSCEHKLRTRENQLKAEEDKTEQVRRMAADTHELVRREISRLELKLIQSVEPLERKLDHYSASLKRDNSLTTYTAEEDGFANGYDDTWVRDLVDSSES